MQSPSGFVEIGPVEHPRDGTAGTLVRNRSTGVYALLVGSAIRSVPHKWAADAAAGMGKGSDAIQDLCIGQMQAMGLNANQVSEMVGDKVSRNHVYDYLSRRSSMGTHLVQHILPVLKLRVSPE